MMKTSNLYLYVPYRSLMKYLTRNDIPNRTVLTTQEIKNKYDVRFVFKPDIYSELWKQRDDVYIAKRGVSKFFNYLTRIDILNPIEGVRNELLFKKYDIETGEDLKSFMKDITNKPVNIKYESRFDKVKNKFKWPTDKDGNPRSFEYDPEVKMIKPKKIKRNILIGLSTIAVAIIAGLSYKLWKKLKRKNSLEKVSKEIKDPEVKNRINKNIKDADKDVAKTYNNLQKNKDKFNINESTWVKSFEDPYVLEQFVLYENRFADVATEIADSTIVTLVFFKKDGLARKLRGTRNLSLIPPKDHPIFPNYHNHPNVEQIYDLDKKAWRRFRKDEVSYILSAVDPRTGEELSASEYRQKYM